MESKKFSADSTIFCPFQSSLAFKFSSSAAHIKIEHALYIGTTSWLLAFLDCSRQQRYTFTVNMEYDSTTEAIFGLDKNSSDQNSILPPLTSQRPVLQNLQSNQIQAQQSSNQQTNQSQPAQSVIMHPPNRAQPRQESGKSRNQMITDVEPTVHFEDYPVRRNNFQRAHSEAPSGRARVQREERSDRGRYDRNRLQPDHHSSRPINYQRRSVNDRGFLTDFDRRSERSYPDRRLMRQFQRLRSVKFVRCPNVKTRSRPTLSFFGRLMRLLGYYRLTKYGRPIKR